MTQVASVPPDSHTNSLILSWAVLVGLTLMSWWLKDQGWGPPVAITLILTLTFVKVFMVGRSFMEIGRAPQLLRFGFAAWCVGICVVLMILAFAL